MPINRIVAFLGPYIAIGSGAVANWLFVHVHLLSEFHITQNSVSGMISQVAVFGISSLLVWLGQHKWLTGWQQYENAIAGEEFNGPDATADLHPSTLGDYDPAELDDIPESAVTPDTK